MKLRLALLVILVGVYIAAPRPAADIPRGLGTLTTETQPRTGAPLSAGDKPGPSPQRPSTGVEDTAAPHPTAVIGDPASYCKVGYCETPEPLIKARNGIRGEATWWYSFGPGLYAAIRPDLGTKGDLAVVCGGEPFHCLTLPVITTCACLGPGSGRLIDLSRDAFASFADPSRGVVRITLEVLK